MMKTPPSKSEILEILLLAVTFSFIAATGIVYHQRILRILPLFISLFVMLLAAQVNRYAYLLGSFNSLLYAGVHWHYGLYATVAYNILVCSPVQIITFLRWNRHAWGSATILKRLTAKQRTALVAAFLLAWAGLLVILNALDSSYQLLDSSLSLTGVIVNILSMLSYLEYAYVNLISGVLSIILYARMLPDSPEQITYLIFSIYSMICLLISAHRIGAVYRLQQEENV